MKILAVDDDPSILELLPLIAGRLGFPDVTPVASGELALEALKRDRTPFECFLLDINMPGMNGIDLCTRIRSVRGYQRTPIIMLTAMSERDYVDRAFKAGATDYATKPFDFVELGARLRSAEQLLQARRVSDDRAASPGAGLDRDGPVARLRASPSLIEPDALVNYLAQLSRAGLAASQVFALRIDDMGAKHPGMKPDERAYLMSEVANAIDEALRTSGHLVAFVGDDNFVIVSNRAALLDPLQVESDIQSVLDDMDIALDSGKPADVEVYVGSPANLEGSTPDSMTMIIERALARAEHRLVSKKNEPHPPNIRRAPAT